MTSNTSQVRLYFIRHAESEINKAAVNIGGQSPLCKLSSLGNEQAVLLGKRFKYQNIQFDHIFCSTAVRAKRTAEIALKMMNVDASNLVISSALLEQSQGAWEGMSRALAFTPEVTEQYDKLHFEFCPPNGESKRMVQRRAIAYLEPIIEQAKNRSVVENREISIAVFTHSNLILSVLQYYLQSNPKDAWLIGQNNTAVNEIVLNKYGMSLVRINDDSHLNFLIPDN